MFGRISFCCGTSHVVHEDAPRAGPATPREIQRDVESIEGIAPVTISTMVSGGAYPVCAVLEAAFEAAAKGKNAEGAWVTFDRAARCIEFAPADLDDSRHELTFLDPKTSLKKPFQQALLLIAKLEFNAAEDPAQGFRASHRGTPGTPSNRKRIGLVLSTLESVFKGSSVPLTRATAQYLTRRLKLTLELAKSGSKGDERPAIQYQPPAIVNAQVQGLVLDEPQDQGSRSPGAETTTLEQVVKPQVLAPTVAQERDPPGQPTQDPSAVATVAAALDAKATMVAQEVLRRTGESPNSLRIAELRHQLGRCALRAGEMQMPEISPTMSEIHLADLMMALDLALENGISPALLNDALRSVGEPALAVRTPLPQHAGEAADRAGAQGDAHDVALLIAEAIRLREAGGSKPETSRFEELRRNLRQCAKLDKAGLETRMRTLSPAMDPIHANDLRMALNLAVKRGFEPAHFA